MLKSFEALEKVANGQATKLIIPSELAGTANLVAAIKEASDLKVMPEVKNPEA
jgi:FKBP-type peptidyl-prolyl cis-trans isomerase